MSIISLYHRYLFCYDHPTWGSPCKYRDFYLTYKLFFVMKNDFSILPIGKSHRHITPVTSSHSYCDDVTSVMLHLHIGTVKASHLYGYKV